MICSKCQFENREQAAFCGRCGAALKKELSCPHCAAINPLDNRFCDSCGKRLPGGETKGDSVSEKIDAGRKYVTVLFSDLSGYTSMSEKMDPEELREITSHVFREISRIVDRYEGFVEKYIGDAVVAIFGAAKSYEDDPVRGIKAAVEIHQLVKKLGPQYMEKIGKKLTMHSGINTGLVVTGDLNFERGTHGITGGALNVAARISSIAEDDEILVGPDTFSQAEGFFDFHPLPPKNLKGVSEPLKVYKVLAIKAQAVKVRRLHGVRAKLVGRSAEMAKLSAAMQDLKRGKGRVVSVCGPAGTGKSRLVEEFKASLDLAKIRWLEGQAFPYAQSIPYFPLIDILNRAFQIEEGDSADKVREKVETGVNAVLGEKNTAVQYIGGLYSLGYPEIDEVSPEFWKTGLHRAIHSVLSALARRRPTVICMEDLHWADPSFLDLLRSLLSGFTEPVLYLCVFRPVITLFPVYQADKMAGSGLYMEIMLKDLSASESRTMVESLLRTRTIPDALQSFIQKKVEGNPFFLEEIVNSLIETKTLICEDGEWRVAGDISKENTSSTIHGVIASRLDRLEKETKRILQEASVIGRAFLYKILKSVTAFEENIDRRLGLLQQIDMIKTKSIQPDIEYIFKHALTQEVVYSGLLKKERRMLHEKIGRVTERLFIDRLAEFYETLAFHFKNGQSKTKAIGYLMKSGAKSLRKFSLEEANGYYKEAYEIFARFSAKSMEEKEMLLDLLIEWSYVHYYRGTLRELTRLLRDHEKTAESIENQSKKGMFIAWLGFSKFMDGRGKEAYPHLQEALKIGEEIGDDKLVAYACTWLAWSSWDVGLLDKAIEFGEKAYQIAEKIQTDQYLFFKPLAAIGQCCLATGDRKRAFDAGSRILNYESKNSNVRSMAMGHYTLGLEKLIAGDYQDAQNSFENSIEIAKDPVYTNLARLFLGISYFRSEKFQMAEIEFRHVSAFDKKYGYRVIGLLGSAYLGIVKILKGDFKDGLGMLIDALQESKERGRTTLESSLELAMGKVYLKLGDGGFPSGHEKSEFHLKNAIAISEKIGARAILSQASFELEILKKNRENQT